VYRNIRGNIITGFSHIMNYRISPPQSDLSFKSNRFTIHSNCLYKYRFFSYLKMPNNQFLDLDTQRSIVTSSLSLVSLSLKLSTHTQTFPCSHRYCHTELPSTCKFDHFSHTIATQIILCFVLLLWWPKLYYNLRIVKSAIVLLVFKRLEMK